MEGAGASRNYNENAFVLSVRSMIAILSDPPFPFQEIIREHFVQKKEGIMKRCQDILSAPPSADGIGIAYLHIFLHVFFFDIFLSCMNFFLIFSFLA